MVVVKQNKCNGSALTTIFLGGSIASNTILVPLIKPYTFSNSSQSAKKLKDEINSKQDENFASNPNLNKPEIIR